jgi:hypothetical protein
MESGNRFGPVTPEEAPPPADPFAAPPESEPSTVPRPSRTIQYVAVGGGVAAVVIVVLLLGFAGILPLGLHAAPAPSVTVHSATLSFAPASNPCFPAAYGGGRAHTLVAGGFIDFTINLTDDSGGSVRACTVTAINVFTPGFRVDSSNVPLLVPSVGGAELNVSVQVPNVAFQGNLTMTANVTYLSPNVNVLAQNMSFSPSSNGGPCGASPPSSIPFKTFAGSQYHDTAGFFVISPQVGCHVTDVSTTTAGFSIVSSSTPYVLPINNLAGVSFVLQVPSQAYTGNVTIVLGLAQG